MLNLIFSHIRLLLCAVLPVVLASCSSNAYKYKIGVSQCVGGPWREKVNKEMLSAQHLYNTDVKVCIANANNNTERQRQQIDSLLDAGVDLLVISPNEYKALSLCVDRAHRMRIPVILFERKTSSNSFTAFIGGDNIEAGQAMGRYAAMLCQDSMSVKGRRHVVLEITGHLTMSPDRERYMGFSQVMKQHPEIDFQHVESSWTKEEAYAITKKWLESGRPLDVVYCQSDLASLGAYEAAKKLGKEKNIRFLGTDALPDEGIKAIQEGKLAASYIYPTQGEQIIELAIRILEHKPYSRVNILKSMVVTPQNVEEVALNGHALMAQNEYLITIQNKLENYLGLYHAQRTVVLIAIVVVILLAIAMILAWRAIVIIRRTNRRIRELGSEQTDFYTQASHQLRTPLTLIIGPLHKLSESSELSDSDRQLTGIIERNADHLSRLVSDVLQFHYDNKRVQPQDDKTTVSLTTSHKAVQKEQRNLVLRDQSDELATVLIVDDNDDMRLYLRTLLVKNFYVVEAPDGLSGLKLARESLPDLIVSDVMMPVMDGLTFCSRVKTDPLTSHIPVVLLTARSSEAQQAEGLSQGADAYLTKPFSADVLLAQINSLLSNRQQLRQIFGSRKSDNQMPDTDELPLTTPDKEFMDTLRTSILKNMGNPHLKMEDLGADMGISRVQLYRKVKALTGQSPVELLRLMRLQKAYKLLSNTDKTVAEVAYIVGFGTPGYFSACFKKQYGKYPTEIRNSDEAERLTEDKRD